MAKKGSIVNGSSPFTVTLQGRRRERRKEEDEEE